MSQAAGAVAVAETPANERLRHVALLVALACLLFLWGLGSLALTDRDEGSNAEAAREMVETGDWVSPTLNYEPRFAKPVFVYWLMSVSYWLFGPSEFSARLPSALFGVALIVLQYLFLARLCPPAVALMGSLMLLLNVEIVAIGRTAIMDSTLIFFTTLSIFGFWLGLHGEQRDRHWFWGFYVGMAVAMLTKGPVGFLVPFLAVGSYLTIMKRWGLFWRRGYPIVGLFLFLTLSLPWYAAMLAIHGSTYTDSASANTIGRFLNVIGGHGGTILFYIPVLAFGFFPWSGFIPIAVYQAFQAWRGIRRQALGSRANEDSEAWGPVPSACGPSGAELQIFAAIWLVVVFLFFSLSATRLPHYIGPLYPAAAILAASYFSRCLTDPSTPGIRTSFRTIVILGYILGLTLAAAQPLYEYFLAEITKEFPMAPQVTTGLSPVVAGAILVVGSWLMGHFGRSEARRGAAMWAGGTMIGLVMLIAIQVFLPHFSKFFIEPPQKLAEIAGMNLSSEDRLILYGRSKPSLIFYAKRPTIKITPGREEEMLPHLDQPGTTMILLPTRLHGRLPDEAKSFTKLLDRYGYELLSSRSMVESPPPHARPAIRPHGSSTQME